MDISRKTDYALRMLAMLAEDPERLLSVRTAAEEVNVPYSFARSIQHGLVQAGIVESLRGVHGGMRLKVSPDDVTIRQVVEAVQGPMVMNRTRWRLCTHGHVLLSSPVGRSSSVDARLPRFRFARRHRRSPPVPGRRSQIRRPRSVSRVRHLRVRLPGGIAPHKEHRYDSGPLSFDDSFGRGPALS